MLFLSLSICMYAFFVSLYGDIADPASVVVIFIQRLCMLRFDYSAKPKWKKKRFRPSLPLPGFISISSSSSVQLHVVFLPFFSFTKFFNLLLLIGVGVSCFRISTGCQV
jgi:hypothetical protein